jgi:hypothetical protein
VRHCDCFVRAGFWIDDCEGGAPVYMCGDLLWDFLSEDSVLFCDTQQPLLTVSLHLDQSHESHSHMCGQL